MTIQQASSPSSPQSEARASWLGLPRFNWTLTLLGLCIFTFAIVTFRFPIGEVGIAIAAVGLVLQPRKFRVQSPVWIYGAFVLWAFVGSLASSYSDVALGNVLESLKLLAIVLVHDDNRRGAKPKVARRPTPDTTGDRDRAHEPEFDLFPKAERESERHQGDVAFDAARFR